MSYARITEAVKNKRAQLEAAQGALRAAEQAVRDLEAELRAWTEVEALLSREGSTDKRPTKPAEDPSTSEVRKVKRRTSRKRGTPKTKRTRAPKGYWLTTMEDLAQANKDFVLSDVSKTAAGFGFTLNPAAIRSQMAHYVSSEVLERVKNGVFRFTPQGKASFLKKDGNSSPPDMTPAERSLSRAFGATNHPPNAGSERELDEIA